jgi:hypothetical protein
MQQNIFILMMFVSLLGAISLGITVKFSSWSGIKLILGLSFSFWGIAFFMAQIETFYFREAFTYLTNREILNIFALLYILIYLIFGYFIAWQFEAVRLFYSGTAEELSFWGQILNTLDTNSLFIPYHFGRGLLWIVFSIPVILMMKGNLKKTVVSLVLIFSYHGFQIIMAQGIFPPAVLVAHTIETTISAGIYGGLIGHMFRIKR